MASPHPEALLVLDLDWTCIKSVPWRPDAQGDAQVLDTYAVHYRPGLRDFLAWALDLFPRVGVWSAATEDYVQPIVDSFGCRDRLAFVWARSRCTMHPWDRMGPAKDLRKLRRSQGATREHTVALDDCPEVWRRSRGNVLPIDAWGGPVRDPENNALHEVRPILTELAMAPDVRKVPKHSWRTGWRFS